MPKPIFNDEQQWMEIIQSCRTSGMTDKAWCDQYGISTTSLYRHIRKLKAGNTAVPGHDAAAAREKHEVVPLRMADSEKGLDCFNEMCQTSRMMPEGPCGIRVSVGPFRLDILNNASQSVLQDTLRILRGIC